LTSMVNSVAHRGPDDSGQIFWRQQDNSIGLGHSRLSIIDLSAEGRQPMTVACSLCGSVTNSGPAEKLWLVYNGELYNYKELRSELTAGGHRFQSQADSEVLIHLYADQGPAMLKRLNGIFAFALYDGRPAGQVEGLQSGDLFLVRDGLGVKPLYYSELNTGFLFASELKSILQCSAVSRELDMAALHYYLAYLWAPAPHTPLAQIKKARPGEAMIVRKGRVARKWSFYDLPYGQKPSQQSENEIAAELSRTLKTAVHRQLVADVPVGAFLSGGLDSSAVVSMMPEAQSDFKPTCYVIGFDENLDMDGSPQDLPYARAVAKHLNVDLCTVKVKPDMIRHLEKMLYHLDEPQADPAPINVFLIAEQARQDGYKVLLSGAGGDDIFSGYRRHWALKMEKMWGWLPLGIRSGISRMANDDSVPNGIKGWMTDKAWFRRLRKAFRYADLSPEDRLIAHFYWSGEQIRRSLYTPEFSHALSGVDTAAPLQDSLGNIPLEQDRLNRMLYLEGKHFLADHNLNYTDKASMAMGVEVRVPLLDPDLVKFAARIPSSMKQKGRMGKAIFKKAMEPYLPKEIIYRPKSGFGAPLRRWLRLELKDMVADVLSTKSLQNRQLFDPAAVRRLIERDRKGFIDGTYTIFALVCIELWCRIFLDQKVSV